MRITIKRLKLNTLRLGYRWKVVKGLREFNSHGHHRRNQKNYRRGQRQRGGGRKRGAGVDQKSKDGLNLLISLPPKRIWKRSGWFVRVDVFQLSVEFSQTRETPALFPRGSVLLQLSVNNSDKKDFGFLVCIFWSNPQHMPYEKHVRTWRHAYPHCTHWNRSYNLDCLCSMKLTFEKPSFLVAWEYFSSNNPITLYLHPHALIANSPFITTIAQKFSHIYN